LHQINTPASKEYIRPEEPPPHQEWFLHLYPGGHLEHPQLDLFLRLRVPHDLLRLQPPRLSQRAPPRDVQLPERVGATAGARSPVRFGGAWLGAGEVVQEVLGAAPAFDQVRFFVEATREVNEWL
jgi:hypothetical protein